MTGTFVAEITNEKGLHARASAKFAEVVDKFNADAAVSHEGVIVSGDSIMGLLMLGAYKGCSIEVQTSGEQADELATALRTLIEGKFDEGK